LTSIFLIVVILTCLLFGIISYVFSVDKSNITLQNFFPALFLYIIGYGNAPNVGWGYLIITALIGIITVSFFTAYLTVNLFWRTGNVIISNDIAIWKKADKYCVSILVGSKKSDISRLSGQFVAYDETGNIIANTEEGLFRLPLLIKKGIWKIDQKMTSGFFYDVIKAIKINGRNCNIFFTLNFVDNITMQEP